MNPLPTSGATARSIDGPSTQEETRTMRTQSRTGRISKLAILAILAALPIFTGSPFCSSDDKKVTPVPPPSRSTPEELLTSWFEKAYNNQDSLMYEQMLDTQFQFEFLLEDAEALQQVGQLP